jgi:hypothetical protein
MEKKMDMASLNFLKNNTIMELLLNLLNKDMVYKFL